MQKYKILKVKKNLLELDKGFKELRELKDREIEIRRKIKSYFLNQLLGL